MLPELLSRRTDRKSGTVTAMLWGIAYMNYFIIIPTLWKLREDSRDTVMEYTYLKVYFIISIVSYYLLVSNKYLRCWPTITGGVLPFFFMFGPSYMSLLPTLTLLPDSAIAVPVCISLIVQTMIGVGTYNQFHNENYANVIFWLALILSLVGPLSIHFFHSAKRFLPPGLGLVWASIAVVQAYRLAYAPSEFVLQMPAWTAGLLQAGNPLSAFVVEAGWAWVYLLWLGGALGMMHCRREHAKLTAYMKWQQTGDAKKDVISWGAQHTRHFTKGT